MIFLGATDIESVELVRLLAMEQRHLRYSLREEISFNSLFGRTISSVFIDAASIGDGGLNRLNQRHADHAASDGVPYFQLSRPPTATTAPTTSSPA